MKKLLLAFPLLFLALIAWFGFNWYHLPEPPVILRELSPEVKLEFSVNRVDVSEIELSLNGVGADQALFTHFSMSSQWTKGRPGLVLKDMEKTSRMNGRGKDEKAYRQEHAERSDRDFSRFLNDNQGKAVKTYAFRQTLTEGEDGKTYLRMSYDGRPMPMLQTLQIDQPVAVPAHISRKFIGEGRLQFSKGTVYFDKKINGFWIPVRVVN